MGMFEKEYYLKRKEEGRPTIKTLDGVHAV